MARYKIDCCTPDCPKRNGECHSTCQRYKEQKAELDEENALRMKKKQVQINLNGHAADCIYRYKKRTRSKNRYGGDG